MKDDVEIPATVPHKRRQLELVLDKWIAVWLASDDITPSERRRLESEKERRRQAGPERPVGLLAPQEGMTPPQLMRVCDLIRSTGATELVHTRVSRKVHGTLVAVCHELGVRHRLVGDVRDEEGAARTVVHEVAAVVAAVKEWEVQPYATPGVWSMVGLARHRSLPVQVVFPNGEVQEGDDG